MDASFFTKNRHRLYAELQPGGFVILPAYHAQQKVNDEAFPFVQEANFWYLTGIEHADWWFMADVATGEEWLVAPDILPIMQIFDGSFSAADATETSGVNTVIDKKAGFKQLKKLLASKQIAYTLGTPPKQLYGFYTNTAQRDIARHVRGITVEDIRQPLARQRAIKQPAEIAAIQAAIDLTIKGATAMLPEVRGYEHEYQAEARLSYEFRNRGADHAFPPIIAAGKSACTIHHMSNDGPIGADNWLLFDIGARVQGYAADLGRTVPLGTPTQKQLDLYESIIDAQKFAISLLTPGRNVEDFMHEAIAFLHDTFAKHGLLKSSDKPEKVYEIMPHALCHGLGVEVHEALGRPETFAEGMILAVEPGVYLPKESIGIRSEDDVLITADGPKVLSAALPNSLAELQPLLK